MTDLRFEQHAQRNLIAPVLIAFLLLGFVLALVIRRAPPQAVDLTITHTAIYPTHTVFKSDSLVIGSDKAEDNLYVIANLKVEDPLRLPLFLKDFTATLTTADDQEITTSAAEVKDLPNIYTSFPALKPLSSAPLRREILIAPGTTAEGMVLLQFPITVDTWNHRKSAILNVDLYHVGKFPITIPLKSKTISTNFDQ